MKRLLGGPWYRETLIFALLAQILVAFLWVPLGCGGEKYPSKPVNLIVPSGVGGSTDTVTRGIKPYFEKYLGTVVTVTNLPGADAVLGLNKVFDSPPNGYTVAVMSSAQVPRMRMHLKETHFGDLLNGFTPVASWLNGDSNAVCVQKDSPYKSFDDVVAKAKQGGVNVGLGSGMGGTDHIAIILIRKIYGGNWQVIPFPSGGEVAAALLGGHIDVGMLGISGAADPAKFRLLVHAGSKRLSLAPDVPSFVEFGHKSLDLSFKVGAGVKKGTDPAIIKTLEDALLKAANDPGFKKWAQETKTPVEEPNDSKMWTAYLESFDSYIQEILPTLLKELEAVQKGK
jgi:tripartite-type tricarboxylate transporter receptor subunit TctC